MPGGSSVGRHQAVVERRGRAVAEVEAERLVQRADDLAGDEHHRHRDERSGERRAVGDGGDEPAGRHGDGRRQRAAQDDADPPRHRPAGRGAADGGEQGPLLALAEPVDQAIRRRRRPRRQTMAPSMRHIMNEGCAPIVAGRYEWRLAHGGSIVPTDHIPTPRGRVAVVTGGNHGIGAATAVALAADGVDVLVTYLRVRRRRPIPASPTATAPIGRRTPQQVLAAIEPLPGRGAAVEADLRDDGVAGADLRRGRAAVRSGGHPRQQRQRLARRHVRPRPDRPPRSPARGRVIRRRSTPTSGSTPAPRRSWSPSSPAATSSAVRRGDASSA